MFACDEAASMKFMHYETTGAGQEHDAGFDAFMTGRVFAALSKRIEIGQLLEQSSKNAALKLEKKLSKEKANSGGDTGNNSDSLQ